MENLRGKVPGNFSEELFSVETNKQNLVDLKQAAPFTASLCYPVVSSDT